MKPVPWFWVFRVLATAGIVVLWGLAEPGTPVWGLFLAGVAAAACLEGLRWGYRYEQECKIRSRRQG